MPFAVALILLVLGSILFHLLSPWTFTPLASNWGMVDFTVDVTLYVTAIIFIAVNLFVAVAIIKYRHREGVASKARYEPENKRLEVWLTVLTAIGVAAMLTPGLLVWARFVEVPEEAHVVEVVGQQWHWTYRYPGVDGKFGQVDAERINKDNPLGIDPEDPLGRDDVVVLHPEAHLPVDRPVKLLLRSKDVLHNYTVAQFRVKMDLVPGMDTYMWLEPTKTGRYEVLCEELCGIAHHTMRGAVVVEEAQEFETWLANQQTFGELAARESGDANVGAAQYAVCAACHGPQGEGLVAMNAPKLAGQDPWYLAREIHAFQAGLRGTHEDDVYGKQMAPMARTLADEASIANVVAHIATLRGRAAGDDGRRRRGARRRAGRHLRLLPWWGRHGQTGRERAALRRDERLVPCAAAQELQGRRARRAPAGLLWHADGFHGPDPEGRSGHQRCRRLHQHAGAETGAGRKERGVGHGLRCNR